MSDEQEYYPVRPWQNGDSERPPPRRQHLVEMLAPIDESEGWITPQAVETLNEHRAAIRQNPLSVRQWRMMAALARRQDPDHYWKWRKSVQGRLEQLCKEPENSDLPIEL